MRSKVESWSGRLLPQGGKGVFIKSVLQSIPTYVMTCFLLPILLYREMERILSRLWWAKSSHKKSMHWCSWAQLCASKGTGVMGFQNWGKFNIAMLAKQRWRLLTNPNSLVALILKAKYYSSKDFLRAEMGVNSTYTWWSIWSAQRILEVGLRWKVGDGRSISILNDCWLPGVGNCRIQSDQISNEFNMVSDLIVPNEGRWNILLVRSLFSKEEVKRVLCISVAASGQEDVQVWSGDKHWNLLGME